ncbi:hypothetical protein ACFOD1_04775 [Pseudidiomarina halophila]|uniref:Uncharacterized protein n=1 Tax=Pseudidiomarina halophila TaxID=1449799 RepID=A0A432XZY0_9GAMM|nr:hypothetical protein [Pseudidiomarina halophila]RUO54244.1 hypothetical protein CWI69_02135 [Pseudidiomarina halophila]
MTALRPLIVFSTLFLLSACGGGGDSSPSGGGGGGGGATTTFYEVSASVDGSGGSVSPTSQKVKENEKASVTLTQEEHFEIGEVTSSCGGALDANVFTTNAVTANCTITASFDEIPRTPSITYNEQDVSGGEINISLPLQGSTSLAWSIAANNSDETVKVTASTTEGLDYTLDGTSGITLDVNDNAVLGQFETMTLTVTNAVDLSTTFTVNVDVTSDTSAYVTAFCLVGYCNGEQPATFNPRGNESLEVTAHYQASIGATANFSYEINQDFGDVESVVVTVFNLDTNKNTDEDPKTLVGEAVVKHDSYAQEITVLTDHLTHDRDVVLEFTVTNADGDSQSKYYDVYFAYSNLMSGSVLEPFTTVNIAELDKEYTYADLRPLDDYAFTQDYREIEVVDVLYRPTFGDSANDIDFTWSYDANELTFKLSDPEGLIDTNQDWISPFYLGIVYYLLDESGNRLNDSVTVSYAPFLLSVNEYSTFVQNRKEAEDLLVEYIKLAASELELDMVLNFWMETFEANGYAQMNEPYLITRNLEQYNKTMVTLVGRLYRMVYAENTVDYSVGLNFASVVNIDFWNDMILQYKGEMSVKLFDVDSKSRKESVNNAAEYKVRMINDYVTEYNRINGTNYGLLNADLYSGIYPNTVSSAETYSLLVGNSNYGSYANDIWLFDGAYSYLVGVHASSQDLFFELIR